MKTRQHHSNNRQLYDRIHRIVDAEIVSSIEKDQYREYELKLLGADNERGTMRFWPKKKEALSGQIAVVIDHWNNSVQAYVCHLFEKYNAVLSQISLPVLVVKGRLSHRGMGINIGPTYEQRFVEGMLVNYQNLGDRYSFSIESFNNLSNWAPALRDRPDILVNIDKEYESFLQYISSKKALTEIKKEISKQQQLASQATQEAVDATFQLQQKKKKLETMTLEVDKKSTEISELNETVEATQKQFETIKDEHERLEQELESLSHSIQMQLKLRDAIQPSTQDAEVWPFNEAEAPNIIQSIRAHLWHTAQLKFSLEQVRKLMASIVTMNLVVLSGPSGTGKSAICRGISSILGLETLISPVQSNWSNKSNLLGYNNPLAQGEESWVWTEFAAFIHSHQSTSVPKMLVLDEMNLAHVEYYFSDFLSQLEEQRPFSIALDIQKSLKLDIDDRFRFLGTVNQDDTTHQLSPKVIDRAAVIRFQNPLLQKDALIEPPLETLIGLKDENGDNIGPAFFNALIEHCKKPSLAFQEGPWAEIKHILIEMNTEHLQYLGNDTAFGFRTLEHLSRLAYALYILGCTKTTTLLDECIRLKVLPRIRFYDPAGEASFNDFVDFLDAQECQQAHEIALNIASHAKQSRGAYNYWLY